MKVSSFIDFKQKYKSSPFRWHVVELYRLGLVSESQILTELHTSRTSLRIWNRAYQRYRLRRYYPISTYTRPLMSAADEIALLKQQLAQTEKLLQEEKLKREAFQTMVAIAEKEFKIPIRKKSAGPPERSQTVEELSRHHPLVSVQTLCGLFGKSRQAWYEAGTPVRQKQNQRDDFQALMLLSEVNRLRVDLPSAGVDVLHYQLTEFRHQHGIKIGRDKLANLLRDSGLLVKRKTRRVRTTWSHHRFFKYPNLTIGKKVFAPNRLWVSDMTYVLVGHGFAYLSLITDAYSRKIVGWAIEESLQATGPVRALKMALKDNKQRLSKGIIHHSDRGVQYCCHEYIRLLIDHTITISMTEQGDPYENALAERVNRTIKEEMLLNRGFINFTTAQEVIRRAIENYNTLRPHSSCDYHTPEQAHRMQGELRQRWRKPNPRNSEKVQDQKRMFATQNES